MLELYPGYPEKNQINQLMEWIEKYHGAAFRFDHKDQHDKVDQTHGTQGDKAIAYMNSKKFDEFVNRKVKGYETEKLAS